MAIWRVSGWLAAVLLPLAALAGPTVTPSGTDVPANLLRIALHLDRPLAAPLDMTRVVLLDSTGTPIQDAFLDLPLAAANGREVALLLHPGRIKTGVGPNLALGPALHSGASVTLRITDPQLGRPLEKHWQIVPALRQRLDPQQWRVETVRSASRQPLRVVLPAALDGAAARLIAVQGTDGERVAGSARLQGGERVWQFTPARNWRPGVHVLRVHPQLEDPQGNRMCSAFEEERQSAQQCKEEGRVEFIID